MRPVIGFVLALVGAVAPTMEGRLVSAEPLEAAADRYVKPLRYLEVFDGVILIARDGRVLLSKAYGLANVELGVANTPRSGSASPVSRSSSRRWQSGGCGNRGRSICTRP